MAGVECYIRKMVCKQTFQKSIKNQIDNINELQYWPGTITSTIDNNFTFTDVIGHITKVTPNRTQLKHLYSKIPSQSILPNSKNQECHHIHILWNTKDPETHEYMMILRYYSGGSLRNYLNNNFGNIHLNNKLEHLYNIANELSE
ncbi:hypothetical protein Glove_281g49 [Diversispora epigaea]|uniref:Protein kinase domain-containing protein n=1 Tax=Diversispora epigaea TaxID=1348612 RepID=A0A397I9Z6_9GLOM|nr:hypothetical protein Glove_281g49 [Diversispora epigaea]